MIQDSPRKGPGTSVWYSGEEYFSPYFHNFHAKSAKIFDFYNSNIYDKYSIKIVRNVPGGPSECPRIIVKSSDEKYFSNKFHHFRAKYFSSFENFSVQILYTVTTECDETGADLINITWRIREK